SANPSMAVPVARSRPGLLERGGGSSGARSTARPRRAAGNTVANETAPNAAAATGLGDTPVYHQFFRRRSTSSNTSQKRTLAVAQAIQSPGVASGERPRRMRARPSRATSTPAQQIGNRNKSSVLEKREAASVTAMIARPQT